MAKRRRLPLCHVNERAQGQGLEGERRWRRTMRPVSGIKSACHYKFSSRRGTAGFGTQKPRPGAAPAAWREPPRHRWAGSGEGRAAKVKLRLGRSAPGQAPFPLFIVPAGRRDPLTNSCPRRGEAAGGKA